MMIRLKLFAGLRASNPLGGAQGGGEAQVPEGADVAGALEALGVPLEGAKIILVNGRHAELATRLEEGDRLSVFPPVGGG